jgi:capsular polysaccharide biosynthesis protein
MTILQTHKETNIFISSKKYQAQDSDIYMTVSEPSDKNSTKKTTERLNNNNNNNNSYPDAGLSKQVAERVCSVPLGIFYI